MISQEMLLNRILSRRGLIKDLKERLEMLEKCNKDDMVLLECIKNE